MDGRLLRCLWVSGLMVVGSAGCNRHEVYNPWGHPGQGELTVFGRSAPRKWSFELTGAPAAGAAVPVAAEPERKGPPRPETYVAFADAQAAVAFDERTPVANREALLDRAREGYQKALRMDPNNPAALLGLARFYTRLGERQKAVDLYQRYLKLHPDDRDVAHEVALAHAQWKDWAGAVAWCDVTLRIDPENLAVRKTKAFCLARGGQWEQAFEVMLQVMPEAQARYNLARVMDHMNLTEASKQQLELALRADPTFREAREMLAHLNTPVQPPVGDGGDAAGGDIRTAGYAEPPRP